MIDTIKIGIEAALRDGNANAIPTAAMINKSARESRVSSPIRLITENKANSAIPSPAFRGKSRMTPVDGRPLMRCHNVASATHAANTNIT